MLTTLRGKKARPIAIVRNGKKDGRIYSIVPEETTGIRLSSQVILDEPGHFEILPNIEAEREICLVFGPSGSGKSHWSSSYVRNFKLMWNDEKPVLLFSGVHEDPVLDKLGVIRMSPEDLYENGNLIDYKSLPEGCLCVFDDFDAIQDNNIRKDYIKLLMNILQNGRHNKINCITTTHMATATGGDALKLNKMLRTESHLFVCFPQHDLEEELVKNISRMASISPTRIRDLIETGNYRWMCFNKSPPRYMITPSVIKILGKKKQKPKKPKKNLQDIA